MAGSLRGFARFGRLAAAVGLILANWLDGVLGTVCPRLGCRSGGRQSLVCESLQPGHGAQHGDDGNRVHPGPGVAAGGDVHDAYASIPTGRRSRVPLCDGVSGGRLRLFGHRRLAIRSRVEHSRCPAAEGCNPASYLFAGVDVGSRPLAVGLPGPVFDGRVCVYEIRNESHVLHRDQRVRARTWCAARAVAQGSRRATPAQMEPS